jgi:hypothetical protein
MNILKQRHQLFTKHDIIIGATKPARITKLFEGHFANRADPLFRQLFRSGFLIGLHKGFCKLSDVRFGWLGWRTFQKLLSMVMAQMMFLPITVLVDIGYVVAYRFGTAFTLHASAL